MHIMKIVTPEFVFEKEVYSTHTYVFDEFGEEVTRYESYARTFEEFDNDVRFLMRNGFVDHEISKRMAVN